MFRFFERQRLIKKGLASPKLRRRRTNSEVLNSLESGFLAKGFIFAVFCAGLGMMIFYGQQPQPTEKFLIAMLIFLTALAQLWVNHPNSFASNSRIVLMFGTMLAHLALAKSVLVLTRNGTIPWQFGALVVPYAFAPLVLSVLLGKNQGLYAATFVSLWGWLLVIGGNASVYRGFDAIYLVMSLICGFIGVFITFQVRRRSRLIRAGVFVGLATWVLAIAFGLITVPWELGLGIDWRTIGYQSMAAIGTGIFTAMFVGGALPILEHAFRVTTEISWLETADLNHPLLRRLTIEAPGTYHHSLVVANLAEAAAEAIGANATMCRACAYFHDIGKLVKPEYFTENMRAGRNPHDDLAPTMSALIIIAHVKEGIDLALKHKLNQQIIDIIQEHHGTSLVSYFHKRALQQQEDARAGGKIMNIREEDIPEVREESFRYGGPKPQTRESGIISLADAIESASRSLEKPTPVRIEQLINDIIENRILDRQLDECPLSLKELRVLAESFAFTLQNMLHSRVAYPSASNASASTAAAANRGAGAAEAARSAPENAPPVSAA